MPPLFENLCQVAVPVPLEGPFTYKIPDALVSSVSAGVRVIVPFGARKLTGVVTGFPEALPKGLAAGDLKELEQVLDAEPAVSEELLHLGRWVAD